MPTSDWDHPETSSKEDEQPKSPEDILRVIRHVSNVPTTEAGNFFQITVSPRAISALQGVPSRRFVGADWQDRLEEASLIPLAIGFALAVLCGHEDGQ